MFRKIFPASIVAAAIAVSMSVPTAQAATPQDAAPPHIQVTWIGGPTTIMEFNGLKILTDPTIGEGVEAFTMGDPNEMFDLKKGPTIKAFQRLTRFPGIDLKSIDLVVLSHAHEDHFDQTAQAQLDRVVPMIVPVADAGKIKALGFKNVNGLKWGATRRFNAGRGQVTITAINAHHTENQQMEKLLGVGNGYWLEFSQGDWRRTIYWTGDSFPTADVIKAVKRLGKLDILIPHVGGVGTTGPLGQISMGADQIAVLAAALSPEKVLPIHHSTYSLYIEPISRLREKSAGSRYRLDLIPEGTSVKYD